MHTLLSLSQNIIDSQSVYLSGKSSHDGKCGHVQCHSGTCNKLLLVHLVAAANYVARTTACLDYYCSMTSSSIQIQ